jgi:hypothetical protein
VARIAFAFTLGALAFLFPAAQGCTGGDAKNCSNISASSYDHSCKIDSDCIEFSGPNDCCPSAAISAAAQAQYMSDFAGCGRAGCTAACTNRGPCCISGVCEFGTVDECRAPPSVEDAGADAAASAASEGGVSDGAAE